VPVDGVVLEGNTTGRSMVSGYLGENPGDRVVGAI
jgi:hypothetical protein